MKTINELQDEVIEEFSDFDDWMDKYQMLIDLGNELAPTRTSRTLLTAVRAAYGCKPIWKTAKWCSRRKVTP